MRAGSSSLTCHIDSMIRQRTRKRHEDDQSDDRDNDYHDDHFWVAEALASNDKRGCNVALASTESHHPSCVGVRSAKQPANPKAQCDEQNSRKDSSRAEDL